MGERRLLVVDNGTHYLRELERALRLIDAPYRLQVAGAGEHAHGLDGTAGIILTGGEVHVYEAEAVTKLSLSRSLLRGATVPVLGLCLGCQLIAWEHGAVVAPLPEAVDEPTTIEIVVDDPLFTGVPSPAVMVMAHSDAVVQLSPVLVSLARSPFGEFEALRHRRRPVYGLQFHPEVSGEPGRRVLANFAALCDWGVGTASV